MTTPTPYITVKNFPDGMSLEDFFNGLKQQQTKRGKKYSYHPIDPVIFVDENRTSLFQKKDIDVLAKVAPPFLPSKIEIQRCDKEQKLSRVLMRRRQIFSVLLNQAAWKYKKGKSQTLVTAGEMQKEIEPIIRLITKTLKRISPSDVKANTYFLDAIAKMGVPLIETRKNLGILLVHARYIRHQAKSAIQVEKKQRLQRAKKSPNTGDACFRNLIDDLCRVWIVVFELDVGIWPTTSKGKQVLGGPMLKFIKAVFERMEIKESDWTIGKAVNDWRKQHIVK